MAFGSGGIAGSEGPQEGGQITLQPDAGQRACLDPEAEFRADLMSRRRVPVLVVSAFTPAEGGGGGILAVQTGTGEETRIGFFPGGAFSAEDGTGPQRFFLPDVSGAAAGAICYELTLLAGTGARAEVRLGVSDPLGD